MIMYRSSAAAARCDVDATDARPPHSEPQAQVRFTQPQCRHPSPAALACSMSGIYQAPPGWVGTLCTYTRPADSHIATVTYNRPEAANAINLEMREDINCKYRTE